VSTATRSPWACSASRIRPSSAARSRRTAGVPSTLTTGVPRGTGVGSSASRGVHVSGACGLQRMRMPGWVVMPDPLRGGDEVDEAAQLDDAVGGARQGGEQSRGVDEVGGPLSARDGDVEPVAREQERQTARYLVGA